MVGEPKEVRVRHGYALAEGPHEHALQETFAAGPQQAFEALHKASPDADPEPYDAYLAVKVWEGDPPYPDVYVYTTQNWDGMLEKGQVKEKETPRGG
jgi:hypothetical protein